MAWNMDANYGKMVNNLLNKEKPPMDENGNYIINAGSRSEKRIPKAEFEAQQKNAPTQTDMETLAKLLTEREANRLKAAQEGSQNPESYNPRAEWVKNNTQTNINYKNNPYFQQNAMGSQRTSGSDMADRGIMNPYGLDSVKGEAGQPYVTRNNATSSVKGSKSNPYTQEELNALNSQGGKNPLKAGDMISSGGKNYFYNSNGTGFTSEDEVKANPQKYSQFNNILNPPQADQSGPTGTARVAAPPIRQTTPTSTQGNKIFTGNTIDTSKDPNNLPYNNPEANKPIFPTDYAGQIALPTPPEEMQLMDYLKKQFEDKTWENKYADLQKQYQEIANRPDKYSGMIEKAGGENQAEYIRSLYEGAADPLRREAQRMQEKNQADLASRGLGMSTVVNDVNNPVQRELMAVLGDLSNQATVQGRQDYINALKSAADVYGQSNAQQGNILNAMQTNIGNQMGAQQIGLANINDILAKQEARRLTNMQTGINQWDKTREDYWKYQYYPIDAYAGQNSTAATAASVGGQVYNQANTNAAGQNQLVGNVSATLANNLFKQPQNNSWVPVGGLSGAQQGGTSGFSTKPKIGAFNQ